MTRFLRNLFGSTAADRRASESATRTRLGVEGLGERLAPAVNLVGHTVSLGQVSGNGNQTELLRVTSQTRTPWMDFTTSSGFIPGPGGQVSSIQGTLQASFGQFSGPSEAFIGWLVDMGNGQMHVVGDANRWFDTTSHFGPNGGPYGTIEDGGWNSTHVDVTVSAQAGLPMVAFGNLTFHEFWTRWTTTAQGVTTSVPHDTKESGFYFAWGF